MATWVKESKWNEDLNSWLETARKHEHWSDSDKHASMSDDLRQLFTRAKEMIEATQGFGRNGWRVKADMIRTYGDVYKIDLTVPQLSLIFSSRAYKGNI